MLVLNSKQVLLKTPIYELGDVATNSIAVRDAKELRQIHGAYSRFGFRHPGPALFYVYATGEWLFFDLLKVVPAPCNGQILANVLLTSFFFSAALAVIARWTPFRCFLPLAIAGAALHYANVGGHVFLSVWTAHPPILIFLALLSAAASVAAGHQRHLPLLALAGGFLVHIHVSQVLYVVPLAVLSYAAFFVRRHAEGTFAQKSYWSSIRNTIRNSAATHWLTAAILLILLLPLVIDAAEGARSNLARILSFPQAQSGTATSFAQSLFFFLQFGTYLSFAPGRQEFDVLVPADAWRFLRANWGIYAFWLFAWAAPVSWAALNLVANHRQTKKTVVADPLPYFIACGGAVILIATGSTLTWGMTQRGSMPYYLGDVNHSIYFFCYLLLAALLASFLARTHAAGWEVVASVVAAFLCWERAPRFLAAMPDPNAALVRQSIVQALAASSGHLSKPRLLLFEHDAWPVATGAALEILRAGSTFVVPPEWSNMFGWRYAWSARAARRSGSDVAVWRIGRSEPVRGSYPLPLGLALTTQMPIRDLNPSSGIIRFSKSGNFRDYMYFGWADSDGDWTTSVGYTSALRFRALPASSDVKVAIKVFPVLFPKKAARQRLRLFFRDRALGNDGVTQAQEITATIPATLWNGEPTAELRFEYPDAVAPSVLGVGTDPRALAVGFSEIRFSQ